METGHTFKFVVKYNKIMDASAYFQVWLYSLYRKPRGSRKAVEACV
jgi:hypothetical protein